MSFTRNSFNLRLLFVSAIFGIAFSLISLVVNTYYIKIVVLKTIQDRANSFIDFTEKILKTSSGLQTEGIKIDGFFSDDEFYKLSLYSESGEILLEKKGSAQFDDRFIPEFDKIKKYEKDFYDGKSQYYSFGKRIRYQVDGKIEQEGLMVLSLNIGNLLNIIKDVNRYRMLIFVAIMVVLVILVYFVSRSLIAPFNKLIINLERISGGEVNELNSSDLKYDELKKITLNFNRLLGSLDEALENLDFSERRLKTLLEKSGDIILMLDEKFKIEYVSSTFTDILGIDVNKAEERLSLSDFMLSEDRKRLLSVYRRILRGENISDFEIRIIDKNNNHIILITSWIVRRNIQNEIIGVILFGKNITEYKKIENALKKRTEALETILFSLSHDLKSPVFTLKGMVFLFKNKYYNNLDDQGRHFIDRISENITRMERMISNMLDISRFERQVFRLEDVNICDLVSTLMSDMREYINESKAKIIVDKNIPVIKADKDKLYIVFKNLLENSFKYRNHSKELEISIKSVMTKDGLEILFEDNGIGIESHYLDKLFRPFSRAISQSDFVPHGYGIGLAIVKGILDAHNAIIKVESSYGEWTRFRICFDRSAIVKV